MPRGGCRRRRTYQHEPDALDPLEPGGDVGDGRHGHGRRLLHRVTEAPVEMAGNASDSRPRSSACSRARRERPSGAPEPGGQVQEAVERVVTPHRPVHRGSEGIVAVVGGGGATGAAAPGGGCAGAVQARSLGPGGFVAGQAVSLSVDGDVGEVGPELACVADLGAPRAVRGGRRSPRVARPRRGRRRPGRAWTPRCRRGRAQRRRGSRCGDGGLHLGGVTCRGAGCSGLAHLP